MLSPIYRYIHRFLYNTINRATYLWAPNILIFKCEAIDNAAGMRLPLVPIKMHNADQTLKIIVKIIIKTIAFNNVTGKSTRHLNMSILFNLVNSIEYKVVELTFSSNFQNVKRHHIMYIRSDQDP
jgi:hypothetical protein